MKVFAIVFYVVLIVFCLVGWTMNLVKFCHCDFEAPYKAESIRGVGIVTGPVGSIMGFITIEDNRESEGE